MSNIQLTSTQGLPEVKVSRTGDIGTMLELAFDGQWSTASHWESETEPANPSDLPSC